jgi:hypothetical protein
LKRSRRQSEARLGEPSFGQFAVWSPDGRFILFAPWLNVIRPDGIGLIRLPVEGTPAEPEMPDWIGA